MTDSQKRGALTLKEVLVLPFGQRWRHPLYLQWLRFVAFGRACPALFFGGMAYLVLENRVLRPLSGGGSAMSLLANVAPGAVYLLFCALPVGIYLTRPMPKAQDGSFFARSAAFLGAFLQIGVALIPAGPLLWSHPSWLGYTVSFLEFVAFTYACYGMLYLRYNLSIIPQARSLVTTGPYAMVRNPLYLAEISAAILNVVNGAYLVPFLVLIVFIALQITRAWFEARLLAKTFDSYAEYAAKTPMLIPGIW